jgi:phosphoesterase RecJ-like protein
MGLILRKLGKDPVMVCQDPFPERFDYLPGFDRPVIGTYDGFFDLLVCLDCSDLERIGSAISPQGPLSFPILNIDHHVTNLRFGTVNLVDEDAVSTTQIVYVLARHMDVPVDERIAACLLTGLVTDTRGFRTSNVTPESMLIAVELMKAGASLQTITRNGLDRHSPATLRLWGSGFSRLQVADGVAWTSLSLEAQRAAGGDERDATGLANILIGVEGARMAAVFLERRDGFVEVGFRAIPGYNVADVALSLGGGGHTLASGCLVPGPLEEAQCRILRILQAELASHRSEPSSDDKWHSESG